MLSRCFINGMSTGYQRFVNGCQSNCFRLFDVVSLLPEKRRQAALGKSKHAYIALVCTVFAKQSRSNNICRAHRAVCVNTKSHTGDGQTND